MLSIFLVVVVVDGGCAVFACCAVGLCGVVLCCFVVLRGLQTQTILLDPRLEQQTSLDRSIYQSGGHAIYTCLLTSMRP